MSTWTMKHPWRGVPSKSGTFVSVDELPDTRQLNPEEELLFREDLGQLMARDGQYYRAMQRDGMDFSVDDPLIVLTERLAAQR